MRIFCHLFGWHRWREMTGGARGGIRYIFWYRCASCGLQRMRKGHA